MANEKIEDVIKKVILGESFLNENEEITEGEDTSDEGDLYEEELEEAKKDEESEDEEDESEDESDEDEDEDEEDEEEDEDEESDGKKKLPAFLKGKFGKKKDMKEAASSDLTDVDAAKMSTGKGGTNYLAKDDKYSDPKIYRTANGKSASVFDIVDTAAAKGIDVEANRKTIKPNKSNAVGKDTAPNSPISKIEMPMQTLKKVKEDMDALFNGQELSEDFKASAATLFEAHLNERVHQIEEEVQAKYESLLEQHTLAVTEELVGRIDEYLNYVVEEWMQENRLAVENGLRTEITENFISGLRGLFAESYIEVPEEKVDLFESTVEEVESLDGELQEQVEKNIALVEEVEQLQCEIVFREMAEGLSDTETEKLRRLAEDLDFDTVEQFAEKVAVLRENIESIGTTVAEETTSEDSLEESYEEASEASPLVEAYVRSMSKREE